MYVCMCVCLYECMHVFMFARIYQDMFLYLHVDIGVVVFTVSELKHELLCLLCDLCVYLCAYNTAVYKIYIH